MAKDRLETNASSEDTVEKGAYLKRNGYLAAAVFLLLAGCASIGPRTVDRDRFDYTAAIANSWKSQMLLNIVKLRYADTPVFLDVSSVISQYSVQGRVNLGVGWSTGVQLGDSQSVATEGIYSERPTITYTPLSGEKFARSLLTPISPGSLVFLIQSGWPVNLLFGMCVKSINGINNRSTAPMLAAPSDPQFEKVTGLLTRIQASGVLSERIVQRDKATMVTITFRRNVNPEIAPDIAEMRKLLGIDPEATEITVTYGANPRDSNEIAIVTRSTAEILMEISSQIDVPDEYVADGRTYRTSPEIGPGEGQRLPFTRVHTGREKPVDAYAAVKNRDRWYWIDDRDRRSKMHFSLLLLLFSLTETGATPQAPLITVPTG